MKGHRTVLLLALVVLSAAFCACGRESSGMNDGYYSAEAAEFDEYGWKEYVTIYVNGGQIITVEYDAFNKSGFTKSWDMEYMRIMNNATGTYPNEYARAYSVALINWQDASEVDAVTGATDSHIKFQKLSDAVIAQSMEGDRQVALVDFSD